MKFIKKLLLSALACCSAFALAAVNVNTAGVAELKTLNGIGEKKAEAIVAYREANGAFTKPEDLLKVKGIGDGILEKIRNDIEFGTEVVAEAQPAEAAPVAKTEEAKPAAEETKPAEAPKQ